MPNDEITLRDIYQARQRLHGRIARTELVEAPGFCRGAGDVRLKLENLQKTGSFKVRGALNSLLSLSAQEKERGVIAFSTGNHGRAVAWGARQLGIRATICLSERVPEYRVAAMRALGARVVRHGASQDEAYDHALRLEKAHGLTMIKPFDDSRVIAGQGTIALEILEEFAQVDTVVVPLSGGGLIAGIALVLKAAHPSIRVVGVSMAVAPAMYHCIQAGQPVEIEERDSLADALLGGIGLDNRYTFALVRDLVDDIVLVSEEEIADGMFFALDRHRLVVEGSGAVGLAAALHAKLPNAGKHMAIVVSGGNVDPRLLTRIAARRYDREMAESIHDQKE